MAGDDKVEVKFGAQTQEIESGAKKASDSVKSSVDQMKGSLDSMKSSITSFHNDFKTGLESVTSSLSKFSTMIMGIGAILAGGALFKGAVDTFLNMNAEAKKMATTMGMAVDDAQALLMAFKRVGVEGDTVTRSMMIMTRQLKTNEQGFNDNKVVTRDASGNLLSMNAIMFNAIERLKELEAGTERNMLATTLFGRSVGNLPGFLKMTTQAVDEMKQKLADLGMTIDDVSVAKARAYKEGMSDVGLVTSALKYKIGEELIPVLLQLGKYFSSEGPAIISTYSNSLKTILVAYELIKAGVNDLINRLRAQWQGLITEWKAWHDFMVAVTSMSWDNIVAAWERGNLRVQAVTQNAMANTTKIYADALANIEGLFAKFGGGKGGGTEKPAGGDAYVPKTGGGGKGGGASILQEWQNELDQLKLANKTFQDQTLQMEKTFWAAKLAAGKVATKEEETNLKAAEKAQETVRLKAEQNFWKEKLANLDAGLKEYEQVEHKIVTLEGQINKARLQGEVDTIKAKMAANQASIKDRAALLEFEKQMDHIDLEMKKENINNLQKLGTISKAKELQEYRLLLMAEQQEELKREKQKEQLYKGDEVKYKEHLNKMKLLEKQQQLDLSKIDHQIAQEQQGLWGKMFDAVGNSFNGLMSSMVNGSKDITSVLLSAFQSFGSSIASIFMEMGMAEVKAALMGTTATVTAAGTKVGANAAVGASGGFASVMSSLPFPANILVAPAIAAGVMVAIMALMPKAEGGWDVPANSMAMLHAGEMVLPASLADNVRNMSGQGGGGNGSTHVTIHAVDAQSVERLFMKNGRALIKSINRKLGTHGKAPLGPSYA